MDRMKKILTVGHSISNAVQMAEILAEENGEEVISRKTSSGSLVTNVTEYVCVGAFAMQEHRLRGCRFDKVYVESTLTAKEFHDIKKLVRLCGFNGEPPEIDILVEK